MFILSGWLKPSAFISDDLMVEKIESLFQELVNSSMHCFPAKGRVRVSEKQGVYIVYSKQNQVLHVGRTDGGENGLDQRLYNHIAGESVLRKNYLRPNGINLRQGGSFRFVNLEDYRGRVFLEALAIGKLCPAYIGKGREAHRKTR
ncbi:MAG: hypothetical protein HEP71_25260 [Roseivirga sp.]|nr:hypothetical protein [Roseivirga sp.]